MTSQELMKRLNPKDRDQFLKWVVPVMGEDVSKKDREYQLLMFDRFTSLEAKFNEKFRKNW
jgi:hypothetical protein